MKIQHPFRTALVATLGVGVGLALLGAISSLQTVFLYVGSALFIALGLDPIVSWLERRRYLKRWSALLITFAGLVAAIAGIVLMVVPILISQISQLVQAAQNLGSDISSGKYDPVEQARTWLTDTFPTLDVDTVYSYVQDWWNGISWGQVTTVIGEGVINGAVGLATAVTGSIIIIILTIYFTASTPSLKAATYQLVPASRRERFIGLSEQITASVGYYVIGQAALGLINGILSAVFLSIIGAPFPAVLAVIAFFFSLIPLVGTLTGSTIIIIVCLFASPATALAALIYYAIYMQVEAYFISPRIMSRAVSVPGAVVVIAALAGGSLLGLIGALIAIPVAASILIIYRQVLIPRQNER